MAVMITLILALFVLNLMVVRLMIRRNRTFISEIRSMCAATAVTCN